MKRRIKKSTKQYIIVALICIIVIGGAAAATTYVMTDSVKDKYKGLLDKAYEEKLLNTRGVYVAVGDIMPGDPITNDNVLYVAVYSQQPQDTFITEADIGKVALIKLPAGTYVTRDMLSEYVLDKEVREVQYDVILINENTVSDDTVDVRIVFPNGEDYIVLSKKVIKNYVPGETTCYFWLNEEEILRMSAAIVDASRYAGTTLSIAKYIEPSIQEASKVTYTPSISTLSLLETNPNILEKSSQELEKRVRKALENRLAKNSDTDVTEIEWEDIPDDIYIGEERGITVTPKVTPTPVPNFDDLPDSPETGSLTEPYMEDLGSIHNQIEELGYSGDYMSYAEQG